MAELLFGRARALAAVSDALASARAGRGQLLLVTGDAGIGKTALVREALRDATGRGDLVAWAACLSQGSARAYWPWVQVLRAAVAGLPVLALPAPLAALAGATAPPAERAPDEVRDVVEARFGLYDALTVYLRQVARRRPLVVVLDDLHWSDEPSLLALRFAAPALRTEQILLIGTVRDPEADASVRELARGAQVVTLSGLDEPAVADLMAETMPEPPDPATVNEVWRRSAGNPFFVRELTRLLGTGAGVPSGIRDVLTERLSRLSAPCVDLLGTAAVAGREFAVDLLARAARTPVDDVADLLQEAAQQGVVMRPSTPSAGYRFVHDLFRETILLELRAADRTGRALTVATTLAALRHAGRAVPAAQLAACFAAAGRPGAAEAVRYGRQAATEASRQLAHEDACAHLERALAAMDLAPDGVQPQRRLLLLDLGDARYWSGRTGPARTAYVQAADLARDARDSAALARAALGVHRAGVPSLSRNAQALTLLGEAAELPLADRGTMASVLAALARELHHQDISDARSADVASRAVALAREHGDPAVLAGCLLAQHDAAWRPGTAAERLTILGEMAEHAGRADDVELRSQAGQLRAAALLELGDPQAATQLAEFCRIVERLRHPRARWQALTRRATLAALDDRLEEAEDLLDAAFALGTEIGEPDAHGVAGTQSWMLETLGRSAGWWLRGADPSAPIWGERGHPLIRAVTALARGDRDSAQRLLPRFAVDDLPGTHHTEAMVLAAGLVAEVGADDQREQTYRLLLPLTGSGVAVGGAVAFHGPVDLYLGALAASLGRPADATGHYRAALRFAHRLRSRAWIRVAEENLALDATFRREGAAWRVRFGGREVVVSHGKGMHDLATLLAAPGQEVRATDLLGIGQAAGADPVLDEPARAAYRARLADLDTALAAATEAHDLARVERLQDERDFLLDELAAAAGLGGRSRRLGDESERVRKTVTARIRHTIGRIARVHPELAAHLTSSVRTGTRCSYEPPEPTSWHVSMS